MKTFRLLFLSILIPFAMAMSGNNPTSFLVLDNYTVPMDIKGAKVGTFIVPGDEAVTLVKDASDLFEIGKEGDLVLKKNKTITTSSPMTYEITVSYGEKQKTFDIVKDEFLNNSVVAHRGGWKHSGAHQNSLGALKHAIEIGCEGSEFDVWLSKDGKVVLNHDNDLEGMIVEKTSLEKLRTVELKKGEVVPTLEEYINLIKTQNKTRLVLEFKSNNNDRALELVDAAMKIINEMNAQAWIDYISFDYRALKRVRAYDATAHLAYLQPNVDIDLQKLDGMNGIDYQYTNYDKIEKLYERCQMLGLTTNAWTVNTEEWMKRFLDLKLDFITTDEPEMVLKLIENRK